VADTGQSPVSSFLLIKSRETGADVGEAVIGVRCSVAPIAWCEVEQTRTAQRVGRGYLNFLMGPEYRMKRILQKLRGEVIYIVKYVRSLL
jgi:hypothetical protein